jgi:uroporphyrinogen decarboxylase
MAITHRERVREMLSGISPFQPIGDLGGRVASLSLPAYLDFKEYLGYGREIEGESITFLNTVENLDERILSRFNIPFRRVFMRQPDSFRLIYSSDGSFHDEWGVGYRPLGPYNERVGHPLENAKLEDLGDYSWPKPKDPGRIAGLEKEVRNLYEETGFSLVAGHVSAGIFQDCWNLRGMAQFLMDMVDNPEFAKALLERVCQVHIGIWEVFLDIVGPYVEIVETADDLAGQNGLLISPDLYRKMIKPHHLALHQAIRYKTQARILYHSCGAVEPLIGDLLETGVDILNPIQPIPGKMDPEMLRQRYGDRVVFHGGLDVQSLLLNGTPQEIRQHVQRYLNVFGPDRYIMAPANSVQPGTPPENLEAAFDEILIFLDQAKDLI